MTHPNLPQNILSMARGLFFCSNNVKNIYFKIQLKYSVLKTLKGIVVPFGNCLFNFFPTNLLVYLNFASNLSFYRL